MRLKIRNKLPFGKIEKCAKSLWDPGATVVGPYPTLLGL